MTPTEPRFPAPDPREVDPRAVRRAFARAAATYDAAAVLQREVGSRMASRLDYIKVAPRMILDAGCGTGEAVGELAVRYTGARVVALDVALPMVEAARERARRARSLFRRLLPEALSGGGAATPLFVCGDVNMLPLPVLDGGHILLALIEVVRRRPVSAKILNYIQSGFAVLLISFMIFIAFFDISDWVRSPRNSQQDDQPITFAPKK